MFANYYYSGATGRPSFARRNCFDARYRCGDWRINTWKHLSCLLKTMKVLKKLPDWWENHFFNVRVLLQRWNISLKNWMDENWISYRKQFENLFKLQLCLSKLNSIKSDNSIWVSHLLLYSPGSVGSNRFALRPCLLLLWTNILSDTANRGPSTPTCVDMITYGIIAKLIQFLSIENFHFKIVCNNKLFDIKI